MSKQLVAAVNSPVVQELAKKLNARVAQHPLRDGRVLFFLKSEDGWQSNSFSTAHELEHYCQQLLGGFLHRSILGGASHAKVTRQ